MCRGLAWSAKAHACDMNHEDPRECCERALKEFDESIRLKADAPKAWMNRGLAWKDLGDAKAAAGKDPEEAWRKAIADYDAAVRLDGGFSDAWMNRASVRLSIAQRRAAAKEDPREDGDKAIADLDKALLLDASDWMTWNNRGAAKLQRAQHGADRGEDPKARIEEALDDFAQSLARNPANWMARANRGMLYERLGKLDEAIVEYQEGLKHAPGQTLLGERLTALQEWKQLPAWAKEAVRASRLVTEGNYAKAREVYEASLAAEGGASDETTKPGRMDIRYNLACIYALASAGRDGPKAEAKAVAPEEATRLRERAIQMLREAIDLGADVSHAAEDADLAPLHDDPRWSELIKK